MSSNGAANPYVARLKSLEALVAEQGKEIAELKRLLSGIGAVFTGGGAVVADEDDLDSKFGNEPIKRDPTQTYWKGSGFVGKRPSECTPEYLDARAKYLDTCAKMKEKDGTDAKKKYAAYDRADAARARGWAKRLRNGWKPPENPKPTGLNGSPFGGGNAFGNGGLPANPYAGGGIGLGVSRSPFAPPAPPPEDDVSDADESYLDRMDQSAPAADGPSVAPAKTDFDEDDDPPFVLGAAS